LKNQKKELQKQLNERKKSMAQLDRAINDIIKKEIEEARRKQREADAEEKRKKEEELKKQKADGNTKKSDAEVPPKSDVLPSRNNTIDPLSQGFAANKNNLPWPVSRGLIVSSFMTDVNAAVLFLSLAIFGADMTLPPSWAFCADIGKQQAGAVSGNMNMAGNLGAFITSLAFPYLLSWAGSPSVFFYIAAAFNIAAVFVWLKRNPQKKITN